MNPEEKKRVMFCAINLFKIIRMELEEDSSSDDEVDVHVMISRSRPQRRTDNIVRVKNYVEDVVHHLPARQFHANFRMTRTTFENLLLLIANELTPSSHNHRPMGDVEKQLLSVIWLLANQESFRSVAERFDLAKSTLHWYFIRIVKVLNKIASRIIKWPTQGRERSQIQRSFSKYGLVDVTGAVDGTYVPIKAPTDDPQRYVNRKQYTAITLQAVAIPSLKYTDCFVGYPSSVGDRRIFVNSDIYKAVEENPERYFDENQYIIGDKAYPAEKWCLPPYIDRGNLQNYETNFNTVHAKTRQVVERSFALLFGRFRRLKYLDMGRIDLIPQTILACCVLHNICLDNEDIDYDLIQEGIPAIQAVNINNQNRQALNNSADGIRRREIIARQLLLNQAP